LASWEENMKKINKKNKKRGYKIRRSSIWRSFLQI
jgi:hypothetical protein